MVGAGVGDIDKDTAVADGGGAEGGKAGVHRGVGAWCLTKAVVRLADCPCVACC